MGKKKTRTLQSFNYAVCLVLITSFFYSNKGYSQCLPGDIGGTVFLELPAADASTANVYGVKDINESGIPGVYVVVVDPNGNILYDTTDTSGNWNLTPLSFPVRVEFSWDDTWLEPAPNAIATNNTDIQFHAATFCNASLGLYYPEEYCDVSPKVVTSCFVAGDPLAAGSTGPIDAVVSFQYDWLNDTVAPYHDALMSDVGAVWGVAYSRRIESAFFSAVMKRHVGLGPSGIGGIYRVDYSSGTATPSSFIDLSLLGVDLGVEPTRSLSADYDAPNTDSMMFDAPGKIGMGDMEISDDGNTLYVLNLKSKKVVTVDLTNFNTTGALPGAAEIDSLPALPALACGNGESRPFALKCRRGNLYVGTVCSGEDGGAASDLSALVYVYDLTAGTWSTALGEFSLDYTKGGAQDAICNTWSPWLDTYDSSIINCHPTPMLTDLEFGSDGALVLCFADRYTFQKFTLQRDSADTGAESVINGGDVLRAYYNGGGTYRIESGGTIPSGGGCGLNGEGIDGGEFYCGDSIGSEHSEIAMGAAALLHGTGEVMLTTINPVHYNSGGVRRFNNTNGSSDTTKGYELYITPGATIPSGGNGYAIKGGGIGDLELLCDAPPIEVYSFIWKDADNDGIQDPDEAGIPNVNVSLYDITGNLQWVDSTDANGFYSFSDTLMPYTDYYLVVGTGGGFNLVDSTLNDSMRITLPNIGMGDNLDKNDSDFTIANGVNPSVDGYPVFAFTTGNNGENHHSFDIGFFVPCVNPYLVTSDTTVCLGAVVDMTDLVSDTTGVTGTYTFYNSFADANAEVNSIAGLVSPADTTEFYLRKNTADLTCFDVDSLIINVNPLPSLLATDQAICLGDTINLDLGVVETTGATVSLTYYPTFADAQAATNALSTGIVYPTDTTEYYVRANTTSPPTCSDIDSLIVDVNPLPNLLTTDQTICAGDTINLDLGIVETTGATVTLTYYPTFADAEAATNALSTSIVYPTDTTQYYVRANIAGPPTCSHVDSLVINVNPLPNLLTNDLTICNGDTTNIGIMVLETTAIPVTYGYYLTLVDAEAETNALASGTVFPTDTTQYYVRANAVASPNCGVIDSVVVNVNPLPSLLTTDITICSGDTTNLSLRVFETTGLPVSFTFYPTYADADAETNALASTFVFPTDTTQYYVRANTILPPTCSSIDSVIINVDPCTSYDLALKMILATGQTNTVDPGDTVTYTMWVYNQGTFPTYDIVLTHYASAGMNFDNTIAANAAWELVGGNPTDTLAGPLAAGDSIAVDLAMVINNFYTGASVTSFTEISSSDDDINDANTAPTDEDSDTDLNGLNDLNIDDEINDSPDNPADDDDHDGSTIFVNSVFDLAFIMDAGANPVDPCDTVYYTSWIYNQGNTDAYNVVVTNYLSTGMNFDATITGNNVWEMLGGNPTDTIVGPIAPGDSSSVTIALVVDCGYLGTSIDHAAELTAYDDDTNNANAGPTDEDSVTDTDSTNDLNIDNEVNDNPDNPADDDDHDGATIAVTQSTVFDLAMLLQTPTNPVAPCDTVTYTMWVYNQGDVPAFNVSVVDYVPSGMTFDASITGNGSWTLFGGLPMSTIAGPIAAGDSASLSIALVVNCSFTGTSTDNAVEIASYDDDTDNTNAGPTDEDSVTDIDNTNDLNIDDEINDSPDNPADDDDHDGAPIVVTQPMTFDLAMLLQTPTNPVDPCDTVTYTMWVYNQGDVPAYDVVVTNYLSTGMNFDASITANAGWDLVTGNPTDTIVGPIAAGDSVSLSIALVVDCSFTGTSIDNALEITGYDDDTDDTNSAPSDEDSVTDMDSTNDPNIDNEINDSPDNPADDDDHDGATISVNQPMDFDLALEMLTPANPVDPCDTVTYTLTVYNQGDMPAYDVVLTDYLQAGMNFDPTLPANGTWSLVGGQPTSTISGPIAPGTSASATISLVVDCSYTGTAISNFAEISAYDNDTDNTNADPTDNDSVTDVDDTNDAYIDNEINDSPDNPADDDDHDGAEISVNQPAGFDLALLMPTPVNPVSPCDTVIYEMWVYNQGPTDAYSASVANYIGGGMNFDASITNNALWTVVGGVPITTITGPIAAGDSAMVSIALVVDCNLTATSVDNAAEIIGYDDDTDNTNASPTDEDSVTDMDATNDPNIDNEINDSPDNPADDDDHDGAVIAITQTFDLALLVQNPAGSLNPCDTVTYTMEVHNQGTVPAYNVIITDYLTTGMNFDPTITANAGWTLVGGQPTFTLAGPIPAGTSSNVTLSLVLDCGYTGIAISNYAELSGYDDDTDNTNAGPTDADSVTDTDDTNDQNIDDEINNNPDNPADDDDHDGAVTPVNQGFDLALRMPTPNNPVGPCDTVMYTMWVYNQGNIPAYNIALSNYTPMGMSFDATITANAGWASVAGLPTYVIAGPLAGGDSIAVNLALVVDCGTTVTTANNAVEISGYDDDTDNTNAGPSDEDSVTDTDSTNDLNIDDEYNDFPDNPGDDDDHDGAIISIVIPTVLTTDTLYYITPFETLVPNICVDVLELGAAVDTVYTSGNPTNGVVVYNSPSECVTYIPGAGYSGQDTACVIICDAMANCDSTILVFTVEAGCLDLMAIENLSADLSSCADEASFCLDIPIMDVSMYSFEVDGSAYAGGIQPCDFDTTYVYTYFGLPGNGAAGPYSIDLWAVGGVPFSGLVPDMQALVDSMNVWDPAGNWMLDVTSFSIRGGVSNTYTDMDVTQIGSGTAGTIPLTLSLVPNGTEFTIASGNHEFVLMETATGCRDTIDIAVTCPSCPDVFAGPYTIEADHCDTTASFCTPIILSDIFDYSITDNGTLFTGQIGGCNHDTIIIYNYASIPGNGNSGPYEVDNWTINGFMYGGVFQDIPALLDSMNVWDGSGNWAVNGFNIEGGNYLNTYGNMVISQVGSVVAILNPNIQLIPASSAVFLEPGPHELIFTDTLTGCVDTAMVQVDCVDCDDIVDSVVSLTADDCDGDATFCMDINPNNIMNYTISVNGQVINGSFLGCENDTMITYLTIGFNNPGAYVLDSWTVDGTTYSAVDFGTAQQLVDSMNVWDPIGTWSLSGLLIVGGSNASSYSTILVSSGGMNVASAETNIQLFPSSSAIALDTGSYVITILDNLNGCLDSSAVTVTCPPAPEDCDFISEDFVPLNLPGCQGEAALCLDLRSDELTDYLVYDNGSLFAGTTTGCELDSIVIYNYSFLIGGGNFGPYMLDSWSVNGQMYSGQFANVSDLVDSMNVWDPLSPWSDDAANSIIRGPQGENNYTSLEVTHIGSSTAVSLPVEYEPFALSSSFGMTAGSHELVFISQVNGCEDTLNVMVACIDPALYIDTISVNETDTLCFDLSELPGVAGDMVNFCESSSGEFVIFNDLTGAYCLSVTGVEVGQDSACIEICDDLGFCDTTWVYVVVDDGSTVPVAWPDVDTTFTDVSIVVTVTNNDDAGPLGIDTFVVIDQPVNGSIEIDYENGNVLYTPNSGYCSSTVPDSMTYVICNVAGCDTSTIQVFVLCDEVSFVNGFSPNGDGVNDYFMIQGLEKYPDHTLSIFNRWGNQVFYSENYQNNWAGTFNEDLAHLPDGTYFYVFEDGQGKTYSGYIQIHR